MLLTEVNKLCGQEIQKNILPPNQPLQNSATIILAKEALEKSGQNFQDVEQNNFEFDLCCSKLWASESGDVISKVKDNEKKAELEKICAEQLKMLERVQKTISNPETEQKRVERNLTRLESSAQKLNDALMADKTTAEKLKFLADSFGTRTKALLEVQAKVDKAKLSDKAAIGKELLIHQTLLKILNAAHIKVEKEVRDFAGQGPEHRLANEELYKTLLSQNSANALTKYQVELRDQNVTARLNHIPEGNYIATSTKDDMKELRKFQKQDENVKKTEGRLVPESMRYVYIRNDKEEQFKKLVLNAQENFLKHTREAITYKTNVQEFLAKFKLLERDDAFKTDLAFGNIEQAKVNHETFEAAKQEALRMNKDLIVEIDNTWKKICVNHSKMYTKLKQSEEAINRKTVDKYDDMYFYTESRINVNGHRDPAYMLNNDLSVKEKMPESYPFLNLEQEAAAKVDAKIEANQATEEAPKETQLAADKVQQETKAEDIPAIEAQKVEKPLETQPEANLKEAPVNEAAVASQIDVTEAEGEKPKEENINLELVAAKA